MMKIRWIVLAIAALVCAGTILAGYLVAGYWMVLPVSFGLALLWLFANRTSRSWGANTFFTAGVFLAGFGLTEGLSFILMLTSTIAGIACWDLMPSDADMTAVKVGKPEASMERHHLRWLAIALGVGWLMAALASRTELNLPFIVVALMALFATGGLSYGARSFKGRSS